MNYNILTAIYTYNCENSIVQVIRSARLLSEHIIVFDQQSTDATVRLAKENNVKVEVFPHVKYVETVRETVIKKIPDSFEWVFILDGDEEIALDSAQEIHSLFSSTSYSHFKIPRKEMFGKKVWLQHGGWWPNHQIRLFKKNSFISWPPIIHSTPQFKGELGYLTSPLLHFSKGDIEKTVIKTTVFEDIESDLLLKAGKNVSHLTFVRKFAGELYRRMFLHLGFLDGEVGIIESIYQAFSKTITYLYLYEKKAGRTL